VRTSLFGLTFKGFIIYLSKSPKLREVQPSSSFEETENQIKTRHRQETTALSEETKKLTENIESNGTFLDYPIFKEIRWLVQRHRSIIWEILETARFIGVHPPFTLDAVSLIEQTEAEIKRLEIEKTMLDNQVIQRAFRKDQPDNLFELNERKLGYAKQNLINLSQLENELWRRDFTKYFAYRCQYLVGIKNMRNDRLAVFFKQAAEKGKLEVDPAEKMANLFSGLNILKDPK
jgi:hypothetical protein